MWWLTVAIFSTVILHNISGSPIDEKLYNSPIEENKFKVSKSSSKVLNLVDDPTTYRLPNNSIPLSYEIELGTKIQSTDKNFEGFVRIHIRIVEDSNKITLHQKNINIERINIFDVDLATLIKGDADFNNITSHDFLNIDLSQNFSAGTELIVEINYKSRLDDNGAGFYWGTYTNVNQQLKHYAATQFEIMDARRAFPCFDEPGIRAVMKLTIAHHKNYSAIANMDIEEVIPFGADYVFTKFKPTPKMQTYLLAFVVSDFDYVKATENSRIPQRIFGTPMAIENGEGDFAASVVGDILGKLEEVLEVDYPLDKMDHVALTKFSFGAMENFGLITYIDRGLLLSSTLSESAKFNQQSSIISLIAHEYAHQWFGDIISPQWWTYTWLNEGFATLFANYIPHLVYPERNFMRSFFTSTMPRAFSVDVGNSWAMNHYTEKPEELWNKFGGIGYQKSGCVLRMFMEVLTPPVFLKGLKIYLEDNYMQAATPTELHVELKKAYDEEFPENNLNINQLMYSWENQPGYPLISLSVFGNTIIFRQRRYPESYGELYPIPITFATKTNPDFNIKTPKLWFDTQTMTISQSSLGINSNDWMVVNIDQVGYYRVDYDTTLWRAIITQLNNNYAIIGPINRALLQDEFYLAWTEFDRVSGLDALRILSYFDKENEAIVWGRAQNTLNYLNSKLFGTDARVKFLEMIRKITMPHLEMLGYEGFDGEDPDTASLRSYIKLWDCRALDGQCVIKEYEKLQLFFNGGQYGNINLCSAMRLIDQDGFNKGIEIILGSGDELIRGDFMRNLGCSLDSNNHIELLKVIGDTSNSLSSDDRLTLLVGLYKNSELGLESALSFFHGNFRNLERFIDINQVMLEIALGIKDEPHISTFVNMINEMDDERLITEDQKQVLMNIFTDNIKWMEDNYAGILQYFAIDEETTLAPTTTTPTTLAPTTMTSAVTTTIQPTTTDSAQSAVFSISLVFICISAIKLF